MFFLCYLLKLRRYAMDCALTDLLYKRLMKDCLLKNVNIDNSLASFNAQRV